MVGQEIQVALNRSLPLALQVGRELLVQGRAGGVGQALVGHLTRDDVLEQVDELWLGPLFAALGDLVVTGPTHTNVNDFRAILVQP